MNYTLPVTVLVAVLLLSGCAASLVYDRNRPARDCPDQHQQCQHSELPVEIGSAQAPRESVLTA